ncbi:hypothetical protein AALP_AAs74635U000100, partial [Arabis alpina]
VSVTVFKLARGSRNTIVKLWDLNTVTPLSTFKGTRIGFSQLCYLRMGHKKWIM